MMITLQTRAKIHSSINITFMTQNHTYSGKQITGFQGVFLVFIAAKNFAAVLSKICNAAYRAFFAENYFSW